MPSSPVSYLSKNPEPAIAGALSAVVGWDVPSVGAGVLTAAGRTLHGETSRRFPLASVTKVLFAYACLVAVEEGTLELDEFAVDGITVRHLLAHAGGYGFDVGPLMAPERKRVYSNTGFEALGEHLTERAEMTPGEYLRAAVLEPLEMDATTLDGSVAHGATSTVEDLLRFAGELMSPTLLAAETVAEATSVHYPALNGILPGVGPQSPNDWGLGFEIKGHKAPHWTGSSNSPATYGHFGAAGTFLWVDPAISTAMVVLTDRSFGPWALEAWPRLSDEIVRAREAG